METKITGIIRPGDTQEITEWVENPIRSISDRGDDIAEIKTELKSLRQSIDIMHKKIDNIEEHLEKLSD